MPDLRLVVAGLNSTMAMSHRQADDRGEVGQAQARWFADRLAGYERAGWFRLAVGHHPPLAADRVHSAKATDAYSVDLILGSHVNLLVAAHGHGAPAPDGPLPTVPARLPRSGTTLISAHPPHPVPTAEAAIRYQLIRVSRGEVTRLDRRFSRRAGVWRAADEVGRTGTVTYRTSLGACRQDLPPAGPPARGDRRRHLDRTERRRGTSRAVDERAPAR